MKILLLASRVPYPLENGEDLRVFHFSKYLSRNHDLHLLAYSSGSLTAPEVVPYFRTIETVEISSTNGSRDHLMSRLVHTFSPDHMYFFDPRISSRLSDLLKRVRFDLLWIPAWQMVPYSAKVREIPVFIDVMDDGVLELARELRLSRSVKTTAVNLKRLFVTYLFERRYFRQAALCSLASERDSEVLRRVCRTATQVIIPNGVDSELFKPLGLAEDYPSLIFEGNMSFSPSVDAVLYFCREILPLIWKKVPQARFYIVGKDPGHQVRALRSDRIIVTGYVDDCRPYLDRASVFVCPMRKGAGIKNKILQAWAMAKPVVGTSVAFGGLRTVSDNTIVTADDPKSFAQKVVSLLGDSKLREELGRRARNSILNYYTWERQGRSLERALGSL